jgi:hypothetical protein
MLMLDVVVTIGVVHVHECIYAMALLDMYQCWVLIADSKTR